MFYIFFSLWDKFIIIFTACIIAGCDTKLIRNLEIMTKAASNGAGLIVLRKTSMYLSSSLTAILNYEH